MIFSNLDTIMSNKILGKLSFCHAKLIPRVVIKAEASFRY